MNLFVSRNLIKFGAQISARKCQCSKVSHSFWGHVDWVSPSRGSFKISFRSWDLKSSHSCHLVFVLFERLFHPVIVYARVPFPYPHICFVMLNSFTLGLTSKNFITFTLFNKFWYLFIGFCFQSTGWIVPSLWVSRRHPCVVVMFPVGCHKTEVWL